MRSAVAAATLPFLRSAVATPQPPPRGGHPNNKDHSVDKGGWVGPSCHCEVC